MYLGQSIKSNMSTSALETVRSRAGRIKGAAMEVKAIVEDDEMKAMGRLVAAWELWEQALLHSALEQQYCLQRNAFPETNTSL